MYEESLCNLIFKLFLPLMFHVTRFGLYFDFIKIRLFVCSTLEQWKVMSYYRQMFDINVKDFSERSKNDVESFPILCLEKKQVFKQLLKDFKADLNYYI